MAVVLSTLRAGRALLPRKIPSTNFCQRPSQIQSHNEAGSIRQIEKKKHVLIGKQTRDLPTCLFTYLHERHLRVCSKMDLCMDEMNLIHSFNGERSKRGDGMDMKKEGHM
jgi:excinuclease UvrABC helicase subunit UvrB